MIEHHPKQDYFQAMLLLAKQPNSRKAGCHYDGRWEKSRTRGIFSPKEALVAFGSGSKSG
jgi:hypothetical protein